MGLTKSSSASGAVVLPRLTAPQARDVFRVALDALAQPGRPYRLPDGLPSDLPPAIVPALALVDIDVPAHVSGFDAARWADTVTTMTGAPVTTIDAADWIVALTPLSQTDMARVRSGSAEAPERGARLTIACQQIATIEGDEDPADAHVPDRSRPPTHSDGVAAEVAVVRITGPGVPPDLDGGRCVALVGVPPATVAALADRNRDFPAGIDTWFCADDGTVIGVPRSSALELIEPRGGN